MVDVVAAVAGLVLLSPFLLGVAFLIGWSDPGPIFFRQARIGRYGRPFSIWKFRTMRTDADKTGGQLTVGDDPRITALGRWLRRYKIDEIPQLINVYFGEMSVVGPRPETPNYVALYDASLKRVLDLMPGITDPASIAYKNESAILSAVDDPERYYVDVIMRDKIQISLDYARQASVFRDMLVVLVTLEIVPPSLLYRLGMASPSQASTTMNMAKQSRNGGSLRL